MATVGRKPKPTKLKELAGNPGKRPLNRNEPKPEVVSPRAPYGLLDKEGQRLWRGLVPKLARLGILTELDLAALTLLCQHYSIALRAERMLRDEGLVVNGVMGGLVKHPAVQIHRDASAAWRQYAEQFGLTPSARSRLSIEPPGEQLSLADLLFDGLPVE